MDSGMKRGKSATSVSVPWILLQDSVDAAVSNLGKKLRTFYAWCENVVRKWDPKFRFFNPCAERFPERSYTTNPGACPGGGEDICGIWKTRSAPKQKHMAPPSSRLSTFATSSWRSSAVVKPRDLVKAGFYFLGISDFTKCFHCDGGLCQWEKGDDPWIEHARWYPECEYVRLTKGEAFIERVKSRCEDTSDIESSGTSFTDDRRLPLKLQYELKICSESPAVKLYLDKGAPPKAILNCLKRFMIKERRGFGSYQELLDTLFRSLSRYL